MNCKNKAMMNSLHSMTVQYIDLTNTHKQTNTQERGERGEREKERERERGKVTRKNE